MANVAVRLTTDVRPLSCNDLPGSTLCNSRAGTLFVAHLMAETGTVQALRMLLNAVRPILLQIGRAHV